jgi:two-component system chemotaxis response regulator CheY
MFSPETQVLIVDDMKTMRKLVTKSLSEMGLKNVTEAEDGQKAWDILIAGNGKFGLVISDWNMPNVSGLEFLKRVRSEEKFKTLPFVLLTAESETAQVMTAISAGVSSYLVKPFSTAALAEKLKAVHKKAA